MIDPLWIRRGLWSAGLLSLIAAAGYGWFRVDWYDYYPAQPPERAGEVVDDPHTEIVGIRFDAVDPLQEQPRTRAGDSLGITGRLKLDPQYWAVPLTQGQSMTLPQRELKRIREENQDKVRPVVLLHIVRKSWLEPGEKDAKSLQATTNRASENEIAWKTSCTMRHPGVYLVRLTVAERDPALAKMTGPSPTHTNERVLKTFLLTVDPYQPPEEQG